MRMHGTLHSLFLPVEPSNSQVLTRSILADPNEGSDCRDKVAEEKRKRAARLRTERLELLSRYLPCFFFPETLVSG